MEEKLLFADFLNDIKSKLNLNDFTLAKYMDCSEVMVSLLLSKKAIASVENIKNLQLSLKQFEDKDIFDFIFPYFPSGFYHGSRGGIIGDIDVNYNKNKNLDFGPGFYLGTSFKQSSTFVSNSDNNFRIYRFSFDLNGLKVLDLRDERWVFFVAYNRGKIPNNEENKLLLRQIAKVINKKYDVIVGPIADDKMTVSMNNFFNNNISYEQLVDCLTQLKIGDQYCLKTKNACNQLKCESIYQIRDDGLREIISQYALEKTTIATKNAEEINKRNDGGKKFAEMLVEYGTKPLF